MEVQSHWFPVWNINCAQCSNQLVGRITANKNGKNIKAELHCPYCDDLELQQWVVRPYEDGDYLLDLEPVDSSGVG